MTRSFLNIITVDGRMCRVAEFGFFADSPSFTANGIVFRQSEKYKQIDLDTGVIRTAEPPSYKNLTSPDGRYAVRTEFASAVTNGIGYVQLMLYDREKSTETVLTRFMGCSGSIGSIPFYADSKSIVFFGYPEKELGILI